MPMDTRDALGVLTFARTDALSVPFLALSSCLAVMPTYLLARDPAVMPKPALADVLVPSAFLETRGSSSSSPLLMPARAREGVVVTERWADGVARPEGVARPWSGYDAWDEASDRCDMTDGARGTGGTAVAGDNFEALTKIPQLGGQVK